MDDIQYVLVLPLPTRTCIFLSDLRFRPVRFAPPYGEFRPLVMEVHQIHIIQCHHDKVLGNASVLNYPTSSSSFNRLYKRALLPSLIPNLLCLSIYLMLSRVLRTLARHNIQAELTKRSFSCTSASKMVCLHYVQGGVLKRGRERWHCLFIV